MILGKTWSEKHENNLTICLDRLGKFEIPGLLSRRPLFSKEIPSSMAMESSFAVTSNQHMCYFSSHRYDI